MRDLVTRATAPLAGADPLLDRLADLGERHPWLWLGLTPPDPRRPLPVRAHVWILATGLAGATGVEAVAAARGELSQGRVLAAERALTAAVGVVLWAMSVGAWERRRRRSWRHVRGRLAGRAR